MSKDFKIIMDGEKYILGDSKNSGIAKTSINDGVTHVKQSTDIGEAMTELFKDEQEETGLSTIDMKSRLASFETVSLIAFDSLIFMGVLPPECGAVSRVKKRLSVSESGKGREEIVRIFGSDREHKEKAGMGGIGDRIKGFVGIK